MSEVKRYKTKCSVPDATVSFVEAENGVFVRYGDYDALQVKLNAVLAENLALKRVPETASVAMLLALDAMRSHPLPDVGLQKAFETLTANRETPVTNAILNEMKASAILKALARSDLYDTDCVMERLDIEYEVAEQRSAGATDLHRELFAYARELQAPAAAQSVE